MRERSINRSSLVPHSPSKKDSERQQSEFAAPTSPQPHPDLSVFVTLSGSTNLPLFCSLASSSSESPGNVLPVFGNILFQDDGSNQERLRTRSRIHEGSSGSCVHDGR